MATDRPRRLALFVRVKFPESGTLSMRMTPDDTLERVRMLCVRKLEQRILVSSCAPETPRPPRRRAAWGLAGTRCLHTQWPRPRDRAACRVCMTRGLLASQSPDFWALEECELYFHEMRLDPAKTCAGEP